MVDAGRPISQEGGTTLGLVVLGAIRIQVEQAMISKPVNSNPLRPQHGFFLPSRSCLEFLPTFMDDGIQIEEMNPFLANLILVVEFHHNNRYSKTKTGC